MTPGEILLDAIQEQLGLKRISNEDMGQSLQDLGADSLDMVELVMVLEEDLGIEISDEDAEQIFGQKGTNSVFRAKNEIDALVVRRSGAST